MQTRRHLRRGSARVVRRARHAVPQAVKVPTGQQTAAARHAARLLGAPQVTYSVSKADVGLDDLRQLYRAVAQSPAVSQQPSSPGAQAFWRHWAEIAEGRTSNTKLQRLLDRSMVIVAAFSRDPRFAPQPASPGAAGSSSDAEDYGPSSSGQLQQFDTQLQGMAAAFPSLWTSLAWQSRQPRRLVGFVRAAGDCALVATIHDLLVHPQLQGFGVGSTLLRRCVRQISGSGVYDVGLAAPGQLQGFFRSCSFDLDREDSVPMAAAAGAWDAGADAINQPLRSNPALAKLLLNALDERESWRS